VRQLPGEMLMAALPEATEDDARIKRVFRNACTGCHTPSYVLQFRFDEDGWNKIIDLMKVVPNSGVYPANPKPTPSSTTTRSSLPPISPAPGDLGKARSRSRRARGRPAKRRARCGTLYDLPMGADSGIGAKYQVQRRHRLVAGDDLQARPGHPRRRHGFRRQSLVHLQQSKSRGHGRARRRKTGAVKFLKVNKNDGLAANAHGLVRDQQGMFWFDVNPGRRSLGRLDPRTEKIRRLH